MTVGARKPSEVLADNVRSHRTLRRQSQGDVAERMRALGQRTWSRQTVSEVERYGRAVTVDELWALALVLDVTPADLLDPVGLDGRDERPIVIGEGHTLGMAAAHVLARDDAVLSLEWTGELYAQGASSIRRQDRPLFRRVDRTLAGLRDVEKGDVE